MGCRVRNNEKMEGQATAGLKGKMGADLEVTTAGTSRPREPDRD